MAFWNTKAAASSNGTGYGGQANDTQRLIAGRKRAMASEHQQDVVTVAYFESTLKKLQLRQSLSDAEKTKLIDTLRTTFRNQLPSEWSSRGVLYRAALDICLELCSTIQLGKLFGKPNDPESLLFCLKDFAGHADMISKRAVTENRSGDDTILATQILKVHRKAVKAAKRANDEAGDLMCLSEQELYQQKLGPLRFDICNTLQHHHFKSSSSGSLNARKIFKELAAFKSALPVDFGGSIFVRAVSERLDLVRALIIGPEGTPYANGCFVFDIQLPPTYPSVPPKVQFVTTGNGQVSFNPNLYSCGKVCLSLLGTWSGPGWISGESTLLQVLVSIQSLILVPDPYFNEPGYEAQMNTAAGKQRNDAYNKDKRNHNVRLCIEEFLSNIVHGKSQYPEFDRVISQHFLLKERIVTNQIREWAKQDPSLTARANNIAKLLATLKVDESTRAAAALAARDQVIEIDASNNAAFKSGEMIVIDECSTKAAASVENEIIELDRDLQARKRAKVAAAAQHDVVDLT